MPVYSEESDVISFSQGLWLSDSPDLHPGYCSELKNLLVSPSGSLVLRPSYIMTLFDTYQIATDLMVYGLLPYSSVPYYPMNFTRATVLNPQNNATNVPILFEPHTAVPSATTVNVDMINYKCPPVASANQNVMSNIHRWNGVGYPSSNYVQYLDKIYAFWSNSGVYTVTGMGFSDPTTVVNLTRTLVGTSPTTNITNISYSVFLDIYKDRMFLSFGNKVYYTETALIGGYPETWNVSTQFFTLPVRTIFKTFVLNNIMYFFTDGGVFALQVLGPPESWILKCINDTISVNHMNAVTLNKGVFYYVNINGIWATNGNSDPIRISYAIDEKLAKCGGIGVFAYEEGCIVCAQTYKELSPGSQYAALDESFVYYFNGSVWVELKLAPFTSGLDNRNCIIVGTFLQVPADASNQRPTTYMTVITGSAAEGWFMSTYFVCRTHSYGDGAISTEPDYAQLTLPVPWSVIPSDWIGDSDKNKRIKYGFLNTFTSVETDIDISLNLDGRGFIDDPQTTTLRPVLNEDGNYLSQFSVDGFVRRLGIKLEGSVDPAGTIVGAASITSPIELKALRLIYSTGRKEDQGVSG
jgi:hypothetical protein